MSQPHVIDYSRYLVASLNDVGQRSITESDVVIVGAGLGGLRCAQLLSKAGLNVVIVEKSDRVGGRLS